MANRVLLLGRTPFVLDDVKGQLKGCGCGTHGRDESCGRRGGLRSPCC
jgi:hypothetical protein